MRSLSAIVVLIVALALPSGAALAQEYPSPQGYVNDFAGLMSPTAESGLDSQLQQFADETSVEIAVVTVADLGGTTIEDYAVTLFERWGIGQEDVDNGVLFLYAQAGEVNDRHWRIEVGYGMEPYITDAQAGRILDDAVLPAFDAGNHDAAFTSGALAIRQQILDSGYEPGTVRPRAQLPAAFERNLWVLIVMGIVTVYLFSYFSRSKSVAGGGIWGAVSGGILGAVFGAGWLILIGVVAFGIGGLLLDTILSSAYRSQVRSGRRTNWTNSWGGFRGGGWGGGGLGGGGFGGGGFGGFGGGRSGGGGASR
jgi:uncharacterized protein